MFRVIKEFKPTWVIAENVVGIKSMELVNSDSALESETDYNEDGENSFTSILDGVCKDLESIGFETQSIIIPACAIDNCPHRRDRVWIVAHSFSNTEGSAYRGNSGECRCGRQESDECKRDKVGSNITDSDCHAPDTEINRWDSSSQSEVGNKEVGEQRGCGFVYCDNKINREWQEPWLEVAQRLCKLDDGLPLGLVGYHGITEEHLKHRNKYRIQKLKALGNAIVPQVCYQILLAIMEASENL